MGGFQKPDTEPIPGYRLLEPLGNGGFGEVWKCEAPGGLFKAIKFVYGNLNAVDLDAARAAQEFQALERVKEVRHPFVLSMERIEVVEGQLLIVMELADRNLFDAFQDAQVAGLVGIPRNDLIRFIRDSAEALDYMCEKHSLQHLDIKPRNLFLVSDRVKVADFGLVKDLERSAGSGLLTGVTPLYASPETFQGNISNRSDQYSLAIVYQELLTGHRPFIAKNVRAMAQQHLEGEPDLRSLPEIERPVIARALEKDPEKRFPSCLSFVRALHNARAPIRIATRKDTGEKLIPDWESRSISDTLEEFHLCEDQIDVPNPNALSGLVPLGSESDQNRKRAEQGCSSEQSELISNIGVTSCQPETGVLRPTLIVAMGQLGRRVMLELRCRLLDRFGDACQIPAIRCLYVDTDPDALKAAQRGVPELALGSGEVYHLSLQPIGHYRRRQLEHLSEWIAREKLYSIPRSLKTQGSRALGRLAFRDHYPRLMARLKREIQQVSHPDVLYESVAQTGLALRDSTPRVVVVGSAIGGTSGCLLDLGYALQNLLKQLRFSEKQLLAFLHCGAPADPATPSLEQANLYATLTEWNHYSEGITPFTAEYGENGPSLHEEGPPYDATYVTVQQQRTPRDLMSSVSHLSSYVFYELTTPIGHVLDKSRASSPAGTPFRSFGTRNVWFPRGLLLQSAARYVVGDLFEQWAARSEHHKSVTESQLEEVSASCARIVANPQIREENLLGELERKTAPHLGGRSPQEELEQLLKHLEHECWEQGVDDPDHWALKALEQIQHWLGGDSVESTALLTAGRRPSRLTLAIERGCQDLVQHWSKELITAAMELMSSPGARVITGEIALQRLVEWTQEAAQAHRKRLATIRDTVDEAGLKLQNSLEDGIAGMGGLGWLVGRRHRPLRVFLNHLMTLARASLVERSGNGLQHFYQQLQAKLQDQQRDLGTVRRRLYELKSLVETSPELLNLTPEECSVPQTSLTEYSQIATAELATPESFWEKLQQSETVDVVLPEGEHHLEQAAVRFVSTLTPEHRLQLDQTLQEDVLGPRGGFYQACLHVREAYRDLLRPIVQHVAQGLSHYLPATDVAQIELAICQQSGCQPGERIQVHYKGAAPLVSPKWVEAPVGEEMDSWGDIHEAWGEAEMEITQVVSNDSNKDEKAYLLLPAGEFGNDLGAQAKEVIPELKLIRVPGQSDLSLCREKTSLSLEEIQGLLAPCQQAYVELASVPGDSPHARFDVTDWIPISDSITR